MKRYRLREAKCFMEDHEAITLTLLKGKKKIYKYVMINPIPLVWLRSAIYISSILVGFIFSIISGMIGFFLAEAYSNSKLQLYDLQ